MNIFIIHSGKDHDRIQKDYVDPLNELKSENKIKLVHVLLLGNGGPFWKFEAKR